VAHADEPASGPDIAAGSDERERGARVSWWSKSRRIRPYLPALAGSSLVGLLAMRSILQAAGRPAAPLDDTFIHLHYARRLVEGGFFSYVDGEGFTSGATSLLWPLLLAPAYALGARGLSLIYVTWAIGLLAHAGVAVETARVAQRLAGRAAGIAAGAMCIAFGAFAWFAWSGMETVPLAWCFMRTVRVAAERCDAPANDVALDRRRAIELVLLGLGAPLLRPEGAIASVLAAVALAVRPPLRTDGRRQLPRWIGLFPLVGPAIQPLLNLAMVGHATSSTTAVKWLVGNPYYRGDRLITATGANMQLLVGDLLNGGEWTAVFLPEGFVVPVALGAVALVACGWRGARWHAAFVAVIALGTLLPCTYLSFLWNRVRYIWPFAGAWFVLVACLTRELGELARRARIGLGHLGPLLAGCVVGALATKLPWTIRDLAQSARAIDRQQVTLGRWAAEHLEPGARIGVNDTGAIAYFGEHATFDVVGLTTEGEAPHWVAGPGSRFEHYERMPPARLPTHFIVYPHWMACPPVLGRQLTEATVLDQSILGGATMVAYEARWDLLGSGALPTHPPTSPLLDEIDVSDLRSEAEHDYELLRAWDSENEAMQAPSPARGEEAARTIADGARKNRSLDRFVARLSQSGPSRLVLRVATDEPMTLAVRVDGVEAGRLELPAGAWQEPELTLPAATRERARLEVASTSAATFTAAHYWIYQHVE
jgi:hypothetical protein